MNARTIIESLTAWIPKGYRIDDEFGCLTNAENLARMNPKLRLVHGWTRIRGDHGKWGAHAWCVAPTGEIVDPYFEQRFPGAHIDYKEDTAAFD